MRFQYALVTLLFAFASAERIAGRDGLRIRQDNNDAVATSNGPTSSTISDENPSTSPAPTESAPRTKSDQDQGTKTASRTGDEASPITRTGETATAPTSTSTSLPAANNSTESTSPADQLPIKPQLNPPLGIAGVILMLAGLALGFVGIKHRGTQTFISTALLAGLGIELLIVYLMQPPASVAIQAAYLIAGALGGCLVAAAALVFQEASEGFGCFLGGFCLSMWILVLAPGGVIKGTTGKIIFIVMLSISSFCLYVSRFTRVYGIIFSTAFAGSTAFVLGLDCFARAGLKEFWLYIWNLNPNTFPEDTNTYPITRPIRAEIAAIIIIAFLGSMSQVKIWKVVKEQRQKRDAQRIQDEEARDALEESVGRDVEERNRHSLSHWEHAYDGKEKAEVQVHDSGMGSIDEDYNSVTTSGKSGKNHSYPLVQIRPATSEQNFITLPQSSSSTQLLPRDKLKTVPSLPELDFNFDGPYYDEATGTTKYASANIPRTPPESATPTTPSLEVPQAIKDRRNVLVKRLSLQSLTEKAALEAAEDEETGTPLEEPSVIASSLAPTASQNISERFDTRLDHTEFQQLDLVFKDPSDDLITGTPSVEVSGPPSPRSADQTLAQKLEGDASGPRKRRSLMSRLSARGPTSPSIDGRSDAGLSVGKLERKKSNDASSVAELHSKKSAAALSVAGADDKKSDAGSGACEVEPEGNLIERLPKKASRAVRRYRTNEWAKEISRAQYEPFQELDLEDPEAVQVETGDAAEAARADENNAAPAPPTPPPQPAQPKAAVVEDRKMSTHLERTPSGAMPTPVYAHKASDSEDSWTIPLGKRASSNPILPTEPGSTPLDVFRNISAPILEEEQQDFVASPVASPSTLPVPGRVASPDERVPSRMNRMSTLPSMPNLMDERRDRMDKRLTSISFMRPSTGLGLITPPKTLSNDSRDGSQNGQTSTVDSTNDDEDMTLAQRRAGLVQRQSQLQQQNTEMASRPLNSRQASGYGFPEVVKQPKSVRMSSQGHVQPLYDSHQPRRASSHNTAKSSQHWNQWRSSQGVAITSRDPYHIGDNQQDMLRAMRIQTEHEAKLREQQKQVIQQQIDTHARMGGLNDAHARALSRMQSKANENAK